MSRRQQSQYTPLPNKVFKYTEPRYRGNPKIFLVSLNRTPERTIEAIQELQKTGLRIEVVPACDGSSEEGSYLPRNPDTDHLMQPGEVGLCMSLWKVASLIVRDNLDWAMFCEDDVKVISLDGFIVAIKSLPEDFHFAHINDAHFPLPVIEECKINNSDVWMKVKRPSYVTVAYLISNAGARIILKNLAPFDKPIDVFLNQNENNSNIYQVKEGKAWFTQNFWNQSTVRFSGEGSIPKTIHRIWLGDNPIPEQFNEYWKTWIKYHPEYVFKTWGNDHGFDGIPDHLHPAAKSDILRLHVLKEHGGLYVDTDFECFHSFDKIIKSGIFIVAEESRGYACNGFMASTKCNHIISEMLNKAIERTKAGLSILEAAGPKLINEVINPWRNQQWEFEIKEGSNIIARRQADTGVVIIDSETLFPYSWKEEKPKSYSQRIWAAHHWSRSWWTKEQWDIFYTQFPQRKLS